MKSFQNIIVGIGASALRRYMHIYQHYREITILGSWPPLYDGTMSRANDCGSGLYPLSVMSTAQLRCHSNMARGTNHLKWIRHRTSPSNKARPCPASWVIGLIHAI